MKNKLTVFAIMTLISFNVLFAQVPAAPVAAAATSITATSFSANWASGGGPAETAYYLDVSTSSVFTSFVSGFNNLNVGLVTTFSVAGLTAGPTYYYRVRGYNGSGSSAHSNTIVVAGIPVATAATSVTNSGFLANWNSVAGATGYFIDVGTTSGGTDVLNNSSVGLVTTLPVGGLTAGTQYFYQLRSDASTANSNIINVYTIPSDPVSSAATNVAGTSFSANWSASTGATGYYLDVASDAGFSSFVSGYNNLALGNVTTYSVTGLSSNTQYWYRVRAFNSGGTSGNSGTQTTTTGPLASAATLITQTSFQANWLVAAANNYLEVSTSPTFAGNIGGNFDGTFDFGVVSTTPVSGLTAGTTYYYRVSIAAATPPYSNTITVLTVPSDPVSSAASNVAGTSLSANWSAASGATGYYLDVATDPGFTSFVTGFNNLNVGNVTTYSVTGLTIATSYYYRVRAYNASGTSGNSGIQNPTTGPSIPIIVTGPANYAVGVTILPSFSWSGGVGYDFQIDNNSDFSSPLVFLNANPSTSYNFAPYVNTSSIVLANGTTYYWRIRKTGPPNSDWTPTREFTTVNESKPIINPVLTGVTTAFISWHPVPYSSGLYYDLLWSTNANMNGYTSVARLDTTTYTLTNLTQGTTYYVQVRAKNTAGTVVITYSTVTTGFTALTPPICYRSYPIDGATSYALKPTMFWYIKGNEPFLDYEIRYRKSGDPYPAPQITSTNGKTYKTLLVDLEAGATYYWQVRSKIGGVYSNWSTAGDSSFVMYTSLAGAPVIPYASWPNGGSTVYVNPPTLYYYIDIYATGLEFQVQYSTSSLVGGGGDFTVSPVTLGWTSNLFKELTTSLIPNQTYYWHVKSRLTANPLSMSAWSSTASFVVASTASGAATTPIPSTPVGGQIIDSPLSAITLYWTAYSAEPLDYEVRIAQSSSVNGSGMLNHPLATSASWITNAATSILVTAIPYTVTAGATYYWQIRSRLNSNNLIISPWSMIAHFSTAAGSSSVVPIVISPNYLQPINNSSAVLTWKIPVPTETHLKYDVQYSKSADFSNSVSKNDVNEPVAQVTGLESNTTYYWRVLSKNDNGSISTYSSPGTFKTTGTTDVLTESAIPTQFELSQNYPNPFNPTTKISYALPQNAFVNIKVYDMLGREVKSLVNNEMLSGNHSIEWNGIDNSGNNVASGAYIYRIIAGNPSSGSGQGFVSTKKMVLLK